MQILFHNALSNAKNNLELAERQAEIAKKISMKFKIKMPFEVSSSFVKNVKNSFLLGSHQKYVLAQNQNLYE